jgi:hypothetical protein
LDFDGFLDNFDLVLATMTFAVVSLMSNKVHFTIVTR